MILIDVLRHGECEGGEIFRGATDVPLSKRGWSQMQAALDAHGEPRWQRIVSSPLRRCREFAEQQAQRLDLPLIVDDDWRELSFGDWEGRSRDELRAKYPEQVEAFYRDPVGSPAPGGEPADAMQRRVQAAFGRCLAQASGERVLLVTHGGVIRALLAEVLGMSLQQIFTLEVPYACLSGIHHVERGGFSRLIYHNPNAL